MTPTPPIAILGLLPELIVLIGGCAVLLMGQANAAIRRTLPWTALLTLALALGATLLAANGRIPALQDAVLSGSGLMLGSLMPFVRIAALEVAILVVLVNWSVGRSEERGEFLSMLLFSLCGLMLTAAADNWLMLFLALELVSIPTYVMVILSRQNPRALEAGTKYFYLGAMSAAIMAYGFSFLYGASGSASIQAGQTALSAAMAAPTTLAGGLAVVGVVLAIVGVLYKIAAFPMHFYVADVYQGAASPLVGWLGFVPKLAGLLALFKILPATGLWNSDVWNAQGLWNAAQEGAFWLVWVLAILSMTIGNILALRQTNLKRMLAYSGVAHSGYMLVGLLAGPLSGRALDDHHPIGLFGDGAAAILYYVVVYGIANLAAFAVLGLLRSRGQPSETQRDVAGLLRREPVLALILSLALLTLMGLPPTPGFWGKLSLFGSAMSAATSAPSGYGGWIVGLVVVAVLNSALAAAYYLRAVSAVLLYESDHAPVAEPREAESVGTLLCGFLLLIFAFYPNVLLTPSQSATGDLRVSGQTELVQSVPTSIAPSDAAPGS